jgi:hypothetical protein
MNLSFRLADDSPRTSSFSFPEPYSLALVRKCVLLPVYAKGGSSMALSAQIRLQAWNSFIPVC